MVERQLSADGALRFSLLRCFSGRMRNRRLCRDDFAPICHSLEAKHTGRMESPGAKLPHETIFIGYAGHFSECMMMGRRRKDRRYVWSAHARRCGESTSKITQASSYTQITPPADDTHRYRAARARLVMSALKQDIFATPMATAEQRAPGQSASGAGGRQLEGLLSDFTARLSRPEDAGNAAD